jgi:hypothetical protein
MISNHKKKKKAKKDIQKGQPSMNLIRDGRI